MTAFKTSARSAVVTGATSGIGRAVALALAEKHLNIAINGFGSEAEIEKVLTDLKAAGAKEAIHVPTDMSRVTEVEHFIKKLSRPSAKSMCSSIMPASSTRLWWRSSP